jgi:hypothetical protein
MQLKNKYLNSDEVIKYIKLLGYDYKLIDLKCVVF